MRTFTVKDYFGFKELEVIELEDLDFYTIPKRNIAIRKEDYPDTPEELIYDKKYPMFVAVTKSCLMAYKNFGEYKPARLDITKTILNKKMDHIIQDRFSEDRFFYDVNLSPILRPFQVKLSSRDWNIFKLREKISFTRAITKVEISAFDALSGTQTLSFLYTPRTENEFTQLYITCVSDCWSSKAISAYIVDELNIVGFKK